MPNIDTSKVKAIASEMIDINNRYRDDFSAVEQAINRLRTDWQQPQKVSSAAFACFDEIKAKFFEPSITERRELAQFLCDAVGIGYEEAENTNKKILEGLFEVVESPLSSMVSSTSVLIKNDFSSTDSSNKGITLQDILGGIKDNIEGIPDEIKDVAATLEIIENYYDELPKELKEQIDKLVPSTLKEAYKHTSDLLKGEFTMENIYEMIDYIGDGSTKSAAIIETIKYSIDIGNRRYEEAVQDISNQIMQGDLYGATFDLVESFVDVVGGGVIDVSFDLLGGATDGLLNNSLPLLNNATTDLTGQSIGAWISDTGEFLAEGVDTITDYVSDGVNYVTDTIVEFRSAICSMIF